MKVIVFVLCVITVTSLQQTNSSNPLTIWIAQLVGTKVTFKADNGKYLARCFFCWLQGTNGIADSAFVHISDPTNPLAQWTPEDLGNGKWALKADTGSYLARCNNCVIGGTVANFAFINVDSALNPLAQWTLQKAWNFLIGPVTLKSDVGTYLTRCNNCAPGTFPDSAGVYGKNSNNPLSIWFAEAVGDKMALRADSGKYLSRCSNCWTVGSGAGPDSAFVQATTPVGNLLAQWTPQYLGNGKWALKGDTGKYLARCGGPGCAWGPNNTITDFAFVNVDTVMNNGYAQWIIEKGFLFPLGPVNLKSDNGNYLSRCNNCGPGSYPDSASVIETNASIIYAIWTAQRVGDNVAFKADNGKYLSRCINCWPLGSVSLDDAFVQASTPIGNPMAQWTPQDLGNGKWGLKGDNGKFLNRCNLCVYGAYRTDFAFIYAVAPNVTVAQWNVIRR